LGGAALPAIHRKLSASLMVERETAAETGLNRGRV
jgi:hypothetical protein